MRHGKKINHLGRTSAHRKAMLANMASSLIMHKKINTTLAKAKALRVYVEPLITKSKEDSTNSRRVVFSYLQDKVAVTELFREIASKIAQRPGGYTRILKTGNRLGDNAEMCLIELVDYNENLLGTKQDKKAAKSSTRRKSSVKKKTETTAKVTTDVDSESAPKEKVAKAKVEKQPKTEDASETQTPEVAE
jgi:large subunit ribosomal protein L17